MVSYCEDKDHEIVFYGSTRRPKPSHITWMNTMATYQRLDHRFDRHAGRTDLVLLCGQTEIYREPVSHDLVRAVQDIWCGDV